MNRVTQPPFKKSLEFNLPNPEKILSSGENEIWYIPSSISEAVKIEIIYKAGKYYENSIGEAQITLHLINKGAESKTANDIANELDYYGSHLDLKVGFDFSSISLYALKKNVERLLPLLYAITQKPSFPNEELVLLKKIFIENLKVNLEKNEFIASNLIRQKIYGSHPYGNNIKIFDIEALTVEEIRRFYKDRFKPFKIFIIGNIDSKILKSLTKNFDLSENIVTPINPTIEEIKPGQQLLDGPNKAQASIRFGRKTISRTHPDWPGLQLVNHILGGYFGSRLMKNIREEKGLTYGIHSSIQSMFYSSFINISAEVNTNSLELALNEIRNELNELNTIEKEELEMAKNHFIGTLQNDITTVFAASEKIKSINLNNLPSAYFQSLIHEVNEIDKDEVARICGAHFNSNQFSYVAVK